MHVFANAADAKQFFTEKIKQQARLDGIALSELELKMLRWTEQYPIPGLPPEELPKLNQEFEEQYDSDEYESKMSDLLRSAFERDSDDVTQRDDWKAAYEVLSKEDHYILVMIENACGSELKSKKKKFLGLF